MKRSIVCLLGLLLFTGCATSTVESRKKERPAAYNALSAEDRELVDKGQIKTGMSQDGVYIAGGPQAIYTASWLMPV